MKVASVKLFEILNDSVELDDIVAVQNYKERLTTEIKNISLNKKLYDIKK